MLLRLSCRRPQAKLPDRADQPGAGSDHRPERQAPIRGTLDGHHPSPARAAPTIIQGRVRAEPKGKRGDQLHIAEAETGIAAAARPDPTQGQQRAGGDHGGDDPHHDRLLGTQPGQQERANRNGGGQNIGKAPDSPVRQRRQQKQNRPMAAISGPWIGSSVHTAAMKMIPPATSPAKWIGLIGAPQAVQTPRART